MTEVDLQGEEGRGEDAGAFAMSRTQQAEHSSVSPDKHSNLRQIHERLVDFIAAQVALSKATLRLADSIVDFYAPEVNDTRHEETRSIENSVSICLGCGCRRL